ncbi:MAG: DUF805 domain-containing protein [Labrenzia sp.]
MIRSIKQTFAETLNYNGRSKRSDYWFYFLFVLLLSFFQITILLILGFSLEGPVFALVGWVLGILTTIPNIALSVRRTHDFGVTGWIVLPVWSLSFADLWSDAIGTLVLVGFFLLVVIGLLPGHKGPNKYGAAPA